MGICSLVSFDFGSSINVETNDFPQGEHYFTRQGQDNKYNK